MIELTDPLYLGLLGLIILLLAVTGWLSWLVWSLRSHYNQLAGGSPRPQLQYLLTQILTSQKSTRKQLKEMSARMEQLETTTGFAIQKIGFMRFNPFHDTGGEQSFVLALLDRHDNGMVFTSLHNREMTRFYAKQIRAGKSDDLTLSEEEKMVIDRAKPIKA